MPLIDLTMDFVGERFAPEILREEIPLKSGMTAYTGVVYTLKHDGMSGTYIDFPGHIAETDDGIRGNNCALENVFRVPARLIRLNRESGSGAVTAADLAEACGTGKNFQALVINVLGSKNPDDVEYRSVYLDESAVEWIIASGCKLLVSDIYESQALHGVFLKLFRAGITAVCRPVNLGMIPVADFHLTALFARIPVTQLPCRLIAEF